jgi:hypothetical protein
MKLFGVKVADWVWVFYPILVVAILLFGTDFLLSTGQLSLVKLASRQEEVEAKEKIVQELRVKLDRLKQVDREKGLADIQTMLSAMPANKRVWLVINQLQQAATDSGAVLSSYKGTVGDVSEASEGAKLTDESYNTPLIVKANYESASFTGLITILQALEKSLPLVKIEKIDFGTNVTAIEVRAGWLAWKNITAGDVTNAMPEYKTTVEKALQQIDGLNKVEVTVPEAAAASASGSATTP